MNSPRPGRIIDARLHLLDRQVQDVNGVPVTTVDDLDLSDFPTGRIPPGTPPPVVTDLLSGSALATRIFGGHPPSSRLPRIPWRQVAGLGTTIRLKESSDALEATWTERWVRDNIISHIPGGRHDPQ